MYLYRTVVLIYLETGHRLRCQIKISVCINWPIAFDALHRLEEKNLKENRDSQKASASLDSE